MLSEEVAGHSIVEDSATRNGNSSIISHMFKLPGVYQVKVVGKRSTLFGRRMKRDLNERRMKSKAKERNKHSKKSKARDVEDVLAISEVRVRFARRDVIDLSPTDWDNYVEGIWELRLLSSEEGKKRYNCPNFYNLDVFTTMHGGKFPISMKLSPFSIFDLLQFSHRCPCLHQSSFL